jgi:flavin reductase (DIM6/NTAB) family NADH-FMN oxidoreductase RutF
MKSITPGEVPAQDIFSLLLGAIAPRPIAFVSTIDKEGRPNLAPFSFFNIFGANPPVVIFSPSRKGRDSTTKHSYDNVKEVPEAVINLVNFSMIQQMNLASSEFPKGINEFIKAGFTPVPSEKVRPFRVKESPVQLECKVLQVIETGDGPSSGNLVICEIIRVHVDETILDEKGKIDQQKADWVARMGGDWYCRANGDALFRVAKPLDGPSLGIDLLPPEIRESMVLTGNDLGRMGLIKALPEDEEILKYRQDETYRKIIAHWDTTEERREQIHLYAQKLLDRGEFLKAVALCIEKPL